VALQRLEDAKTLLRAERTTGAIYLAGYAVECMLKAIVLFQVPVRERTDRLAEFKGRSAHSFERLKELWSGAGGERFSRDVARDFATVASWSTEFRYTPGVADYSTAEQFLNACHRVLNWADRRISHG
jgi:hypothetical protein